MAHPKQTASSGLSRTLAGQLSKSEKVLRASRDISQANKRTLLINKAFKNNQILNK
jgi:hypothetical protein